MKVKINLRFKKKITIVIICPFLFRNKVHSFRDGIIGSNPNEEKYPHQ